MSNRMDGKRRSSLFLVGLGETRDLDLSVYCHDESNFSSETSYLDNYLRLPCLFAWLMTAAFKTVSGFVSSSANEGSVEDGDVRSIWLSRAETSKARTHVEHDHKQNQTNKQKRKTNLPEKNTEMVLNRLAICINMHRTKMYRNRMHEKRTDRGNPLVVSLKRILWTGLKTNECIDSSEREEENEIVEQRTRSFVRRRTRINRKGNADHSFDVCLANGKSGELELERSPPRSNFESIPMSMFDIVVYIDGRAAFLVKVRLLMFMLNATSRESWASSISKRRSACGSKSFERISKKSLMSLALNSLICGNWRRSVKWRM